MNLEEIELAEIKKWISNRWETRLIVCTKELYDIDRENRMMEMATHSNNSEEISKTLTYASRLRSRPKKSSAKVINYIHTVE